MLFEAVARWLGRVSTSTQETQRPWPLRLFSRSVLKQRKFREITDLLDDTRNLHCLDIGGDSGVISYLLRIRGGAWKSADLGDEAVWSIRSLVGADVFKINGSLSPFDENEFDRVVIVDFLEHIETDKEFVDELFRIMKPSGELIINVPNIKNSLLRKARLLVGQTDEKHGHVRPGYTLDDLVTLLGSKFSILCYRTYSKFFSECIDSCITLGVNLLKKGKSASEKGMIVTEGDLDQYRKAFHLYSIIYPVIWIIAKCDALLPCCQGYMLIAKARCNKQ